MEEGWEEIEIGKGEILRNGDDLLLVGYGTQVHPALQVAEILSEHGIEATVVNARFVKPLDTELILPLDAVFVAICRCVPRLSVCKEE